MRKQKSGELYHSEKTKKSVNPTIVGAKKVQSLNNYLLFRDCLYYGGKMKTLKLYYIDDKYIEYLRKFDSKVFYNKKKTRPYVGVVYTFNNHTYFAPLSSPKAKHLKMNSLALDIFKINDGKYGIVNINNMIPVPKGCLVGAIANTVDLRYRNLLILQTHYLNIDREKLLDKVKQFQYLYKRKFLPKSILDRCCDFALLEDKCKEYENNLVSN